MELKIGNSCGSCIHTNKPKKPREHAAHYETAKTERWCFKHNCHVTRETTCDNHEGINRGAKTAFTRVKNFNKRQKDVLEVVELMKNKGLTEIQINEYVYYLENGWIKYSLGRSNYKYSIRNKESSTDRKLKELISHIK